MTTKITAATKTPKTAKTTAPSNSGLRKAQVRILAALAKSKRPMTRKEIAEKAPCDLSNCTELIGSANVEVRKANDAKHFPCLLTLGAVKAESDEETGTVYTITAKGRTLVSK